jgi:hypothetical protein
MRRVMLSFLYAAALFALLGVAWWDAVGVKTFVYATF